ncbi:hypothetical protein FNV43_RR12952 [Rhamnella rubrinervis]|uniref:Uncharacterized protein n=1 Tax=Rhamnella rubrinervis TaxID=2594499 RepID=A0A8K0MEE3_9ROSA|nr:hypothetical protein FNV43_RR12952 [Rhamnella rubrinervis]
MVNDWMRNLEVGIPTLLEDGIKVLVYAGEYNLLCNWLGNSKWFRSCNGLARKNSTTHLLLLSKLMVQKQNNQKLMCL